MNDDRIAALESRKREIENWMKHPVTLILLEDNKIEQEKCVNLITSGDLETHALYSTTTGHLRGLRRAFGVVEDELDGIKREPKELQ